MQHWSLELMCHGQCNMREPSRIDDELCAADQFFWELRWPCPRRAWVRHLTQNGVRRTTPLKLRRVWHHLRLRGNAYASVDHGNRLRVSIVLDFERLSAARFQEFAGR